jgi:LemA protein
MVTTTAPATSLLVLLAWITAAGLGAWLVVAFNRLVRLRNLVREAWAGIDVQLKRRHDLVPNLVETVEAYGRLEREVLTDVARLRSDPGDPAPADLEQRENALTSRLRTVLAVAEDYPELLASRSFLDLQHQLADVEDHLQMARRYYNGSVRDYNTAIESFPSNLVAALFRFSPMAFFSVASATERRRPDVELET